MAGKRVAVVGSRSIRERSWVYRDLDRARAGWGDIACVVSGGAIGVDALAAEWARERGIEVVQFFPEYQLYGRQAPLERNHTIVENCDVLIAFWDGKSRGTMHSVELARRAGKPVVIRTGKADNSDGTGRAQDGEKVHG